MASLRDSLAELDHVRIHMRVVSSRRQSARSQCLGRSPLFEVDIRVEPCQTDNLCMSRSTWCIEYVPCPIQNCIECIWNRAPPKRKPDRTSYLEKACLNADRVPISERHSKTRLGLGQSASPVKLMFISSVFCPT